MVSPNRDLVYSAVDLSRLPDNPIAETQLTDILEIGREVDTLETIRRSEKDSKINVVVGYEMPVSSATSVILIGFPFSISNSRICCLYSQ